ncbi:transcription factor grauzone-like [Apis florea]|uniref:transcription factor grauzone-like n=1 Tax=Apis florea TaxID=7463 RepID=UPI0012FE99B5|nr:transcription factor grauzone-like [Apis florea]
MAQVYDAERGGMAEERKKSVLKGFHACCECKKTYRSRMALNRHVREECGRVLYTCPFCHSIMPMKFNLLNHLKKEHGCVAKI